MNQQLSKAQELINQSRLSEAEKIIDSICLVDNTDSESWHLLAICQSQLGHHQNAISSMEECLAFNPFDSKHLATMGRIQEKAGNHEEAIKHYEKALHTNTKNIQALLGLGSTYVTKGELDKAALYYHKATEYEPNSALAYNMLGHIACKQNKPHEQCLPLFQKATELAPLSSDFQSSLGQCLLQLNRVEEAEMAFQIALSRTPDNPVALNGMVTTCARKGEYQRAEQFIDYILIRNLKGADIEEPFLIVCKHLGRCDEAVKLAKERLKQEITDDSYKERLHMKLALVLDAQKKYQEAWHHLTEAKKLFKPDKPYNPLEQKAYIDTLIKTYTRKLINKLTTAHDNDTDGFIPIFIVGMPRSGTSLTEQILASHSHVTGGGELFGMPEVLDRIRAAIPDKNITPHDVVSNFSEQQIAELAMTYKNYVLDETNATTKYVTDKLPHNFYALGLIRILLPEAKIIHCQRDPFDTCLSIYLQKFISGHEYSADLFHLGTHYRQYQELMLHWRGTLGEYMHEVQYETLVSHPDITIPKLLEFCGLNVEDNCLTPHKNKRRVDTASFDQVRQPINTSSIKKWRNYEIYLDDLKLGLERGY